MHFHLHGYARSKKPPGKYDQNPAEKAQKQPADPAGHYGVLLLDLSGRTYKITVGSPLLMKRKSYWMRFGISKQSTRLPVLRISVNGRANLIIISAVS